MPPPTKATDLETLEISLLEAPKNRRRFLALKGEDQTVIPQMPGQLSPEAVGLPPDGMNPVDRVARQGDPRLQPPAPAPPKPASAPPAAAPVAKAESQAPPAAAATAVLEPEPEPAAEPDSEPEVTDEAPEPAVDPDVLEVANAAYAVTLARTNLIPRQVADAVAYILGRTNIQVEEPAAALDEEGQVHVRSLLALIPEGAPDDIGQAAAVVQAWAEQGFPLFDVGTVAQSPGHMGYDDMMGGMGHQEDEDQGMMQMPAPAPKRVVDSGQLTTMCNKRMRDLIEAGQVESAATLKGFCDKVKKALPEGGFVVVSGVVPRTDAIPMVNLTDLWKSGKPEDTALIQSVVDDASRGEWSLARQAAEDIGLAIDAFKADLVAVLERAQDRSATIDHVNQAFTGLAPKIQAAVNKALPEAAAAPDYAALQAQFEALSAKLAKLESGAATKLSFAPAPAAPAAPPAGRSLRASPPRQAAARSDGRLTVSQIVDAAAGRYGRAY